MNEDREDFEKQPDKPETSDAVGFRRPPKSTRFKKGVSGNPKGRPKGSFNIATVFMKTLRERVVIIEHGQRRSITKLEAALKQLVNKSAAGDLRAIAQLRDLAREAEAKQNSAAAEQRSVVGDLDEEVMQGILQRFQQRDPQSGIRQSEEVQDGSSE